MKILSKNGRRWRREVSKLRDSKGYGSSFFKRLEAYYKPWCLTMLSGSTVEAATPWISYFAINYIERYLSSEMKVFEFGGGGSTLFFAKRVKKLVTVEHDSTWFKDLDVLVRTKGDCSWNGFLIEGKQQLVSDVEMGQDIANPDHYCSDDVASEGLSFYEYASKIDSYPDGYFDLILVDGRSRPSCLKHAIPKCRSGGLLVLDNSDRAYYTAQLLETISVQFDTVVEEEGPAPFLGQFTKTTVWRKH